MMQLLRREQSGKIQRPKLWSRNRFVDLNQTLEEGDANAKE
jgi:hypothetical protein